VGGDLDRHRHRDHEGAFEEMIPILGAGTAFFVVVLPAALFRRR
jgi:hypothetical protein